VKLLLDQNLSPRLLRTLEAVYPGSSHVRLLGLRDADDVVVWEFARDHDFIIVSKDSDFHQRSFVLGFQSYGSGLAIAPRQISRRFLGSANPVSWNFVRMTSTHSWPLLSGALT
jgi:hypothetical protein